MTRRRALICGAAVVGAVALLLVAAAVWFTVAWQRVGTVDVRATAVASGSTTYAIVGLDSREHALADGDRGRAMFPDASKVTGERADIVLLVRKGPDGTHALSVPRDLLVTDRTGRTGRLAVTWEMAPQAFMDGLCSIGPGIGVDHVVALDYRAVVAAVDAAGGYDVTTTTTVRDRKSHLRRLDAGTHTLDGEQALAWVRSRHLEERTDDGWGSVADQAQREQTAADLLDEVGSRRWSRSPWLLASLPSITEAVRVDPTFGIGDARALLSALSRVDDPQELPTVRTDGDVPTARLTRGGEEVAAEFAGDHTCDRRR